MTLSRHDAALIRDLRQQPLFLVLGYILVGLLGLVLAIVIEFHPLLKVATVFLSGFLVGISGEKLVTRRIRTIALTLLTTQSAHTPEP